MIIIGSAAEEEARQVWPGNPVVPESTYTGRNSSREVVMVKSKFRVQRRRLCGRREAA